MWHSTFKKLSLRGTAVAAMTVALAACSTPEKTPLTLHVFDCGEIEVRDESLFSPGVNKGKVKNMVNSCYLIQHEKGTLVWDAGLNDAVGAEGTEAMGGAFFMKMPKTLMSQLNEISVKPQDIDYLGISHFHGDHTGNANLFTGASLIIQQEEYAAAFGDEAAKFGFEASSYKQLDRDKIKVINGDHDVFADGSVIIKRAPGHTPGHQVLFLNLAETGPVLLSGDLYHFTSNRTHQRVPSFNFNKAQTLAAMADIEAFVKEKGAQLWIQHDLEQNAQIKHSPEFYR
ncbi:MAG: N-acyl homoserine lactonase family protein [Bermanella sp.]